MYNSGVRSNMEWGDVIDKNVIQFSHVPPPLYSIYFKIPLNN